MREGGGLNKGREVRGDNAAGERSSTTAPANQGGHKAHHKYILIVHRREETPRT